MAEDLSSKQGYEGLEIEPTGPQVADRGRRLAAMVLDLGVAICLAAFLAPLMRLMGVTDRALVFVMIELLAVISILGYPALVIWQGSSPGKQVMGLWICDNAGKKVASWRLVLRETIFKIMGMLVAGPFWIFLNPAARTPWDMAAGTLVVVDRRYSRPDDNEKLVEIH